MITYEDVLKKASEWSDIQAHLVRLYDFTVQIPVKIKVVVELGVREGNSTTSLLAAVNDSGGHLYSIDIDACIEARKLYGGDSNWTFIRGDDMQVIKGWNKHIDHLFIDTSHTFDHTLNELREWGKWVKHGGIITLHDIYVYDSNGKSEVLDAIEQYMKENPEKYDFKVFEGSYGLGLLRRK